MRGGVTRGSSQIESKRGPINNNAIIIEPHTDAHEMNRDGRNYGFNDSSDDDDDSIVPMKGLVCYFFNNFLFWNFFNFFK